MASNKAVAANIHTDPMRSSVVIGSRAPGLLARRPTLGWILFIFGSLVFGGLAYNLLARGPLLAWDAALATALPAVAVKGPAFLKGLMQAGFYIGDQVVLVLAVLLGLYFIFKRWWKELTMLAAGLAGSSALFLSLSHWFARPRPPSQIWTVLSIPGFPSGHAITVVVFYGLLAYFLVPKMPSAAWKAVVVAFALLIIAFVGFSRVFTAGHYLTDVLAGYAVGIAWSGAVYTLIEIIFQKNRSRNVKAG